jgi:adenylosuccinate lyase
LCFVVLLLCSLRTRDHSSDRSLHPRPPRPARSGTGLGHSLLAYQSALRGVSKLTLAAPRIAADLDASWEVLTEPVQTVMRRYGVPEPYEKLKAFSRGRAVTAASVREFVDGVEGLPEEARAALRALTPATYVGNAAAQARALPARLEALRAGRAR